MPTAGLVSWECGWAEDKVIPLPNKGRKSGRRQTSARLQLSTPPFKAVNKAEKQTGLLAH